MAKKKHKGYIAPGRKPAYDALRRQGASKEKAARIANKGRTRAGRKAMAKRAAATRRRRKR